MADLGQRANDLTEALRTYDAILVLAVEIQKLQIVLNENRRKLGKEDQESYVQISTIMKRNAGL